ncbi:hypothetical protein D3C81_1227150 [compost metagenome]
MQRFNLSQCETYVIQRLGHHRLAHTDGEAHLTEQPGNLCLMLHHEIRLFRRQACQRLPRLFRRAHRMQLFARTDRSAEAVANDE